MEININQINSAAQVAAQPAEIAAVPAPVTPEAESVEVNGMNKEVYVVSGGYGSGFWHHFLTIDLEELSAGNLDEAFHVIADVHDTAGMSFRQYHGIDISRKLPDGATSEGIQSLCDKIAARAEELTQGFSVEWNNGNERAVWRDEDGDDLAGFEHPGDYWTYQFEQDVADIDCVQTYDLSYDENRPFVMENAKGHDDYAKAQSESDVRSILDELYEDDSEWAYSGHAEAAESVWEKIQEERAEESDDDES